jgi:chromatin segregation and condensation protein Rec8/ScpA/Scc1 (kleisin family)
LQTLKDLVHKVKGKDHEAEDKEEERMEFDEYVRRVRVSERFEEANRDLEKMTGEWRWLNWRLEIYQWLCEAAGVDLDKDVVEAASQLVEIAIQNGWDGM